MRLNNKCLHIFKRALLFFGCENTGTYRYANGVGENGVEIYYKCKNCNDTISMSVW